MIRRLGLAIPLLAMAHPAHADPIPAQTELLLRTAAGKSDAVLGSTADVAKKAFPKSAKEIDALVASYQANYHFNDRLYLLGLTSWEGDRFSGFDSRSTEALGFGYTPRTAHSPPTRR